MDGPLIPSDDPNSDAYVPPPIVGTMLSSGPLTPEERKIVRQRAAQLHERTQFWAALHRHFASPHGPGPIFKFPLYRQKPLDLYAFYKRVGELGGSHNLRVKVTVDVSSYAL